MRIIEFVKSILKKSNFNEYEWNRGFSISVGEICESCFEDLDLYKGGFTGKHTKCESCDKQFKREDKLNQLGI